MADQVNTFQVVSQVEHTINNRMAAAQSSAQVEHTIYDRMSIYQVCLQVEHDGIPLCGPILWVIS